MNNSGRAAKQQYVQVTVLNIDVKTLKLKNVKNVTLMKNVCKR